MRRPNEPVPRDNADDLDVIIGKPERWWLGSPAISWPSRLRSDSSGADISKLYHALSRGRRRPGGAGRVLSCIVAVRRDQPWHCNDRGAPPLLSAIAASSVRQSRTISQRYVFRAFAAQARSADATPLSIA